MAEEHYGNLKKVDIGTESYYGVQGLVEEHWGKFLMEDIDTESYPDVEGWVEEHHGKLVKVDTGTDREEGGGDSLNVPNGSWKVMEVDIHEGKTVQQQHHMGKDKEEDGMDQNLVAGTGKGMDRDCGLGTPMMNHDYPSRSNKFGFLKMIIERRLLHGFSPLTIRTLKQTYKTQIRISRSMPRSNQRYAGKETHRKRSMRRVESDRQSIFWGTIVGKDKDGGVDQIETPWNTV